MNICRSVTGSPFLRSRLGPDPPGIDLAQQRVLGLLFGQPARRFQSAELIRLAHSGTGATHRLLQRLAQTGLVRATAGGGNALSRT